jgi:hypothetical protein
MYGQQADMARNSSENMVLRTVYLDPETDELLRVAAFCNSRSKNDIIREMIETEIRRRVKAKDPLFSTKGYEVFGSPVSVPAPVERPVRSTKSGARTVKGALAPQARSAGQGAGRSQSTRRAAKS